MSLNYKIINYKAKQTKDNTKYIDLMSDTLQSNFVMSGKFIIVNKSYVARPDLISLAAYGDDCYGDLICKVNGISNPFTMNENDVLFIPSEETVINYAKAASSPSELIKDASTDVITRVDTGNQKKRDEVRSSNEQIVGESNYVIDKSLGLVFY